MKKFFSLFADFFAERYTLIKNRIQEARLNRSNAKIEKQQRLIELRVMEKYKKHRIALQNYRSELDKRREAIEASEEAFKEKEKLYRAQVNAYIAKKMDKFRRDTFEAQENAQKSLDELREYQRALKRTEYTILDWLKRVDKKERTAFDEIASAVDTYKKYNSVPPEDGFQFEHKIASILKLAGYENVEVTQASQDYGADVLAQKDGVQYVVQCKYYTSAVGVAAVQQVFASKMHYSAHVAVVATNSVFTKAAKVLASETKVLLWDGLKLQEMMDDASAVT